MTHHQEKSPFALHNRREVVFILEELAKNHTTINLDTREGIGLVTSILDVNSEKNFVYLDISLDEKINDKIRNSELITFTTQTGIKVRWHAMYLQLVSLADGQAFSMPIPDSIERIQRREYFRMSTQKGVKSIIGKIPFEAGFIEAPVVDLSVGGLGIMIKGALPVIFVQGETLEGCSIDFPEIGKIPFSLKICGVWGAAQTKSGEPMHHIGFEFVNLGRGVGTIIQRHMLQLERDRISLK